MSTRIPTGAALRVVEPPLARFVFNGTSRRAVVGDVVHVALHNVATEEFTLVEDPDRRYWTDSRFERVEEAEADRAMLSLGFLKQGDARKPVATRLLILPDEGPAISVDLTEHEFVLLLSGQSIPVEVQR